MQKENSSALFPRAKEIMPGGVNSPVRAFNSVGGEPLFIKSAKGSKINDVDGNEFIDYVSSWVPLIFGFLHKLPGSFKDPSWNQILMMYGVY